MAEQKHIREFMQEIIEKHEIDVDKEIELAPEMQHIMNCNDNYAAFHTYKTNKFFQRETT